jgi:hypothetical protein
MTKDEHVKCWMKSAEDDFTATESLFVAAKYNLQMIGGNAGLPPS